jgi:nitric oxide reductase subunit B
MVVTNLFPGGVLQLADVLRNGYWHARGPEFLGTTTMRVIEWLRLPGDFVFIGFGVVPACIAAASTYTFVRRAGEDRA